MPIGNSGPVQLIVCVVLAVLGAYLGGRLHQWYMHGMDRDRAFREGYAHGYSALFPLAARGGRSATDGPALEVPVRQFAEPSVD